MLNCDKKGLKRLKFFIFKHIFKIERKINKKTKIFLD
jgi:hypothetical protein